MNTVFQKEYWRREAEIADLDKLRLHLKNIDPYVDYDLEIATENYKMGFPAVTSFYCAVALEDQLSAIYEAITNINKDKLLKVKGKHGKAKIKKLADMNLSLLIDWALEEKIIDKTFNYEEINAIRLIRNFFGHSARSMCKKTETKVKEGKLKVILPTGIMVPADIEEIIKYFEKSTGDEIDLKIPTIGWLYNDKTAINVYSTTMGLIEKFSQKFPSS